MGNIYDYFLTSLFREFEITSNEQGALQFIARLKEKSFYLWDKYQTKDLTDIDYSNKEIQAAYLLRYFPHYTVPVQKLLEVLKPKFQRRDLSILLFGAGPGPEILAILLYFDSQPEEDKPLSITFFVYDVNNESWGWCDNLIHTFCNVSFKVKFVRYPSNSSDINQKIELNDEKLDMVVLQNCFNELKEDCFEVVIDNVIQSYLTLNDEGILLLVDRPKYGAVSNIMKELSEILTDNHNSIVRCVLRGARYEESDYLPNFILAECGYKKYLTGPHGFLSGESGHIPRNHIDFLYAVFQKG